MRFLRPIGTFGVVIVFTIYLLMKREDLRHRILLLAGIGRISLMTQALQDAATRISQYLLFQAAVNAAYGILFGCGLFLIGVPNATLWGVIAGLLRIVPYVGTATGVILPLSSPSPSSPPGVRRSWSSASSSCLELTATNFVEPWLFSSRTGISSLALLAMAIFWALLWGWPGLILSTPLTVCMVVLGRYVPQMSFLHTLLGTDAELSAEALFYERLLAMDQQEAHAVANRFLEGKSLVQLYDSVLIPALDPCRTGPSPGNPRRGPLQLLLPQHRRTRRRTNRLPSERDPGNTTPNTPVKNYSRQSDFAVVCISASDQADELTTHMLVQVMEQASHQTLHLSAASVSTEILESLANEPNTVVFISALPPFAFSQARSICQRVRLHLPHNRIVIGLWNTPEDPDQTPDLTIERFGNGRPTLIVTTLAQALQQVTQWRQQPARNPPVRT